MKNEQGAWKDTMDLKWNWKYIMNGKGVLDEGWYIQDGIRNDFTSIRVFDTINKHWSVTYFATNSQGPPSTWTGGKVGDKIILKKKQTTKSGPAESILTFSNISDEGFHWEGKLFFEEKQLSFPFWKIWCVKEKAGNRTRPTTVSSAKNGKIKVTILYPYSEGKTFDTDYYSNKHMPMVANLLGDAMKGFSIDKGLAGGRPSYPIPYLAIGYLYFDKLSDYEESFAPSAKKIVSDIPNFTNIKPIIQISEILE
ncbi:MAG: EthD family reductase [Bacteroidota bacterium]